MTEIVLVSVPIGYEKRICKVGKGKEACSSIGRGENGFLCLKGGTIEANLKIKLHSDYEEAKGDNCSGPPFWLRN